MFGVDLWDASLVPALMVATVAGLLSFLSPCVLPIVPPYLAFMAGSSMEEMQAERGRTPDVQAAVFFVLGLSTVFLFLGLAASAFGRLFLAYQREMSIIAGVVILVFGLHFLGVVRIPLLYREARFDAGAAADRPSARICWDLPSPSAGRPASGRCWARSCRSRRRRVRSSAECCSWVSMPSVSACRSCLRRCSCAGRSGSCRAEAAHGGHRDGHGGAARGRRPADDDRRVQHLSFWLLETFPVLGKIG